MDKDPGYCRAGLFRWYFNMAKKACEGFLYGGCGGNGNRFNSKIECEARCANSKFKMNIYHMNEKAKCTVIDCNFSSINL